jgi:WS/DGAT/MGAT family acyltransferase
MRNLTSVDAFFLASEDDRTTTNISSLAILDRTRADGTPLTRDHILELIGSRLNLLPPLRWRLAEVPFNIAHPSWIDGEVDLEFHVRELALPAPGDQRQLAEQVARLVAHPMDRSRPLWQVYLIHGLEDDRVALLTKMHHAAVDGMSGAEIMSILLDGSPSGREIPPSPPHEPEEIPGQLSMLLHGIAGLPRRQLDSAAATTRSARYLDQVPTMRGIPGLRVASRAVRALAPGGAQDGQVLNAGAGDAPKTPFNGRISAHRRVELIPLSLDRVRAIKDAHGTTVNDVLVAVCAGALRRWLDSTGDLPERPLIAMVPVSVRADSDRSRFGNYVSAMAVPIPTDEPGPVARLKRTREAMQSAKRCHNAVPASLMRDANDLVPPILFGRAMRAMTRLTTSDSFAPAINVVISNVPGSRSPLYCAGALMRAHFPVSTITDGLVLNITVFSYRDQLNVGLVADRDLVPNLDGLAAALEEELDLLAAEEQCPPVNGNQRAVNSDQRRTAR